jgi:Protein of unknown function (DUF2793)
MALTLGPNLGLLVDGATGEEHYTELMRQFRGFDLLIQCRVINRVTATPPGSAIDGVAYIVAASPTGAWSGHANHLARYSTKVTAWEFFTPKAGWKAYDIAADETVLFDGSAWVVDSTGGSGSGSITSVTSTGGRLSVSNPSGPVVNIDLADSGVTPGSYPNATVSVDAKGRVIGIVAGAILTVALVTAGAAVVETLVLPSSGVSEFVQLNYV